MNTARLLLLIVIVSSIAVIAGCAGRPSLFPNADPALRKTSAQFAADAARRHPYKADAPRGGEVAGRAQVDYTLNQLEVVNLSQQDWENVELWVNRKFVVFVPRMQPQKLKALPFQMIYDEQGNSIPTTSLKEKITRLEAYTGGKVYSIPVKLAD